MIAMKILSIQSAVAYGHVGNSAAVFPLQRIGVEVLPVYTVNFSNHTGYGAWRGPLIAPTTCATSSGIEERGVGEIDVVLSGYQGGEGIADVILDAVARVKAANPAAVYACDPVMGNAKSGCFVAPAIPVLLRERVVPAADIITPNQFELGFLTETEPTDLASTLASADAARAMGPRPCSSRASSAPTARGHDRDARRDDDGAWIVQTPRIPMKANGSGDVTAALFTAHYATGDAADAWRRRLGVRPAAAHQRVRPARAAARRGAGVLRPPPRPVPRHPRSRRAPGRGRRDATHRPSPVPGRRVASRWRRIARAVRRARRMPRPRAPRRAAAAAPSCAR
jgi:pyridoxine kinase